jgi:hypothetical protein
MKKPCTGLVPPLRVVVTAIGPGNMALTTRLAMMAPTICAGMMKIPRKTGTAPVRTSPMVTAGLNCPPETRKKMKTVAARDAPKQDAMLESG